MPSIGIIGAGNIGRAIAAAFAKHDIPATLANSRGPESLADIIAAIGPGISAGELRRKSSPTWSQARAW